MKVIIYVENKNSSKITHSFKFMRGFEAEEEHNSDKISILYCYMKNTNSLNHYNLRRSNDNINTKVNEFVDRYFSEKNLDDLPTEQRPERDVPGGKSKIAPTNGVMVKDNGRWWFINFLIE